jgi:hydroxypyruvate reductase
MDLANLRHAARKIFDHALLAVDARQAVRTAVQLNGSHLALAETELDLASCKSGIYVAALGKAATAMATGLDETLSSQITAGVITAPLIYLNKRQTRQQGNTLDPARWQFFAGGHPLPNEESLNAAQAVFELLARADEERGLVIFLISGGGSAMIEWPCDDRITLADLRKANRLLVSCGATITEINAVRRGFSAVKGGGLAARASRANQITLIVSDTNPGDEASVASGPTMAPPVGAPDAETVVARYPALANLPAPVLAAINHRRPPAAATQTALHRHYVLLENRTALAAAAETAIQMGFHAEIADDILEQPIADGCQLLLSRLETLRRQVARNQRPVCLISGGEFACPVVGDGVGGRNAETALRCAIAISGSESRAHEPLRRLLVLSTGTDGIDGNSPAAGAIADETTIARARTLGLDARDFLDRSDAFSFFKKLGDAIATGATGTNARDVRILLAG